MHTLLKATENKFDVVLIQEPWFDRISPNGQRGSVAEGSWAPILPYTPIANNERPRVVAYYAKTLRPDLRVTLRTDIVQSLDTQVLEIRQSDHPPVLIANIYNQPSKDGAAPEDYVAHKIRNAVWPHEVATIITGDWNLHHEWWEPTRMCAEQASHRAKDTAEWLDSSNFTLMNTPDEPTRFDAHNRDSTIDLTFANAKAIERDVIREWVVDPKWSGSSDHAAIRWIIDQGAVPINTSPHVRYNFKRADIGKFSEILREGLDAEEALFDALCNPRQTPTEQELELAAEAFARCLERAVKEAVPARRPSSHAKSWWNSELQGLLEEVQRLNHQCADARRLGLPNRAELEERRKKASRKLCNRTRKVRQNEANARLKDATQKEVFRFRAWTEGRREYPSPAFKDSNGRMAVQHEEKCKVLRARFYPDPTEGTVEMPDLANPAPTDIPWVPVTRMEVKEAIYKASTSTAPGPSGITAQVLRWAWGTAEDEVFHLLAQCANIGYHPKAWKQSITIALRKPRKEDYSVAGAWRPINLLEEMGKVGERIASNRIRWIACSYGLLPHGQFGSVPKRSTTDAAMTFVHDVECAWNQKLVTSALTFDISGAYDHVSHPHLLSIMRQKRFPLPIVRWVASFLTGRRTAISLDGQLDEMQAVNTGIPQGSPVSPILFVLFASPIESVVEQHFAVMTPERVRERATMPSTKAFVDDGMVYVSSNSLETNTAILEEAFEVVLRWANTVGIRFDPKKIEFMHYTRRRKEGKANSVVPAIKIPKMSDVDPPRVLDALHSVRWLGIIMDRQLNFKEHVKLMSSKATSALGAMKMLANTRRGLRQPLLRSLYISCVLPILTYASPVWWLGKEKGQNHLIESLELVQNKALRWICAAFKTTPIRALEIESAIMPIRQRLDWANAKYAIRLNGLDVTHPVLQRLPDPAWHFGLWPYRPPPLPPYSPRAKTNFPSTRLIELSKRTDPRGERLLPFLTPPWRRTELDSDIAGRIKIVGKNPLETKAEAAIRHMKAIKELSSSPDNIIVYSDGSQVQTMEGALRTGAGIVAYKENQTLWERSIGLGMKAEVYDAEMEGLASAMEFIVKVAGDEEWGMGARHIYLYADNVAAVQAIFKGVAAPGQQISNRLREAVLAHLDAHPENTITIEWVPGHSNVPGNERSDEIAKTGTAKAAKHNSTLTHAKRKAKEAALIAWRHTWVASPPAGGFALADRFPPHCRRLSISTRFPGSYMAS